MPNAFTSKKILIAPLDWGLGHATRCVPVVTEFLKQGCEVQIASSGDALILLKEEFPSIKFHSIVSYRVKYSASLPFMIKMIMQIPKFLKVIREEHLQIERIVEVEKIDIVISDNRYGCWSNKTKSIFIGHQLKLKTPFFSSIINSFHERSIKRFSECWVPDVHGDDSLVGELAINPKVKPKYIGLLSRMQWQQSQKLYDILAIVSGPEPLRKNFEDIVIRELAESNLKCMIVKGLPGVSRKKRIDNLEIVNHLNGQEMNKAILESEWIIARSGYSTIMDLATLGKKAIFIPTPGQVEQEYLASRLMKKKIAFSMRQDSFNLQGALSSAKEYTGFVRRNENTELSKTIKDLLDENS